MTKEERKLWYSFLRDLPIEFHRQKIIGNYIADFYCAQKKIVIELDGSQHYEEDGMAYDAVRDAYFVHNGITVLRYSNREIADNFSGVCEDILMHIS